MVVTWLRVRVEADSLESERKLATEFFSARAAKTNQEVLSVERRKYPDQFGNLDTFVTGKHDHRKEFVSMPYCRNGIVVDKEGVNRFKIAEKALRRWAKQWAEDKGKTLVSIKIYKLADNFREDDECLGITGVYYV